MEENVLKNDETFYEFPDKKLKISENDNIYLLKYSKGYIVVRQNIELITNIEIDKEQVLKEIKGYYSVIDNKKILTETLIYSNYGNVSNLDENFKLLKLSDIFRVPEGCTKYFDLSQISALNNFNDEYFEYKNPILRKKYF